MSLPGAISMNSFWTTGAAAPGQSAARAPTEAQQAALAAQMKQALEDAAPVAAAKAEAAANRNATPIEHYTAIGAAATGAATPSTLQSLLAKTTSVAQAAGTLMTTPATGQTSFYTQAIAQGNAAGDNTSSGSAAPAGGVAQQFLNFASETPMQRMRAQILKGMNLTEQQVAQMTPAAQAKVEDVIKEKIRETMKQKLAGGGAGAGIATA